MTSEKFHAFCEALSVTPASMLIQNVTWIIPSVQTVHIICISILIGAIGMVNLRVLGLAMPSHSISNLSRRLLPYVWGALPVLLITGVTLIVGEPSRSLESPAFQLKMVLLVFAITVTVLFQNPLSHDEAYWDKTPARSASGKLLAVISLLIWVSIIFAGRYIAYTALEN